MALGERRKRADLATGFRSWLLENRPSWTAPQVEISRPQSGLSSETVFLDVTAGDALHRLVARMPPRGDTLFPDYDLARQFRVQQALAHTDVPVAPPLAHETDLRFVGTEFLLMPRVEGRTLTTAPAYVADGWLFESPPEQQRAVVRDFVRVLASIHRLPVSELSVGDLSGGGPDLASSLTYWDDYLTWATADEVATKTYRDALAWCRSNVPGPAPVSLLWGDPQLVNLVFDDNGEPAAVLDWELASLGHAEADLSWFLTLHEAAAETAGTELPGFPPREVVIGWFEQDLGRPLQDLAWYDVFAHVRSGAIVVRIAELMRQAGHPTSWADDVPQPHHIRRLIGV